MWDECRLDMNGVVSEVLSKKVKAGDVSVWVSVKGGDECPGRMQGCGGIARECVMECGEVRM